MSLEFFAGIIVAAIAGAVTIYTNRQTRKVEAARLAAQKNEENTERIEKYMDRLERNHDRLLQENDILRKRVLELEARLQAAGIA